MPARDLLSPATHRERLLARQVELLAAYRDAGGERRRIVDMELVALRGELTRAAPERTAPRWARDGRALAAGDRD